MALDALNPDAIRKAAQTLEGSAQPEAGQKEPVKVDQRYYPARQLVQQAANLSGLKGASKLTAQQARKLLEELGFGEEPKGKPSKTRVKTAKTTAAKEKTLAPPKEAKPTKPTPKAKTAPAEAQPEPKAKPAAPIAAPVSAPPVSQEPAAAQIRRRLAQEPLQHADGCFGLVLMLVLSVVALVAYGLL
jgi:hypothetical protein